MFIGRSTIVRASIAACSAGLGAPSPAHAGGPLDILWQTNGHTSGTEAIAFSSDGLMLASGGDAPESSVKLWRVADGTPLDTLTGHEDGVRSVAFSADQQFLSAGYLVAGYPPGGVNRVHDLVNGWSAGTYGGCHVDFAPAGHALASGGGGVNRYVAVNDAMSGQPITSISTGTYITDVAFTPDGAYVASGGTDNAVHLWNAASGQWVRSFPGHADDVQAITFSPNGAFMAAALGGWDVPGGGTISLWRVADAQLLDTFAGHDDWTYDVAFSPDGRHVLSAGRDGSSGQFSYTVRIWSIADGAMLAEYDQVTDFGARAVAYAPNGSLFAFGNGAGDVVVAHNPLYCMGDLDGDGAVNALDLIMLLAAWNGVGGLADLNSDGAVDVEDLVALLGAWGPCS